MASTEPTGTETDEGVVHAGDLDPGEPVAATAADLKAETEIVDNPDATDEANVATPGAAAAAAPTHAAVNDENGNPFTVLDSAARQPLSTDEAGPLRSRIAGETYDDYCARAASLGGEALDQAEWEALPVT